MKYIIRNELIMLPVPKPRFFAHKIPVGVTKEDYEDEIIFRQEHVLREAIDRVSYLRIINSPVQ